MRHECLRKVDTQSVVAISLSASPAAALQGLHHPAYDETGGDGVKNFKKPDLTKP
jgi:hypothetical protein